MFDIPRMFGYSRPAYHYWHDVHPCYYCRRWERGSVRILKEAWIVKIERNSPRAMKPVDVTQGK